MGLMVRTIARSFTRSLEWDYWLKKMDGNYANFGIDVRKCGERTR